MDRLIILDRDGVINIDSEHYIKSPEEWIPYTESLEAIKILTQHGFKVFIATNQSGLGRQYFDEKMLSLIHRKMIDMVNSSGGHLSGIFYCPHLPEDYCDCRKPKPGLLYQIAAHLKRPLLNTVFIGDSWRDIQAGQLAGCEPILVRTGNGESTEKKYASKLIDIKVFDNLLSATENYLILKNG